MAKLLDKSGASSRNGRRRSLSLETVYSICVEVSRDLPGGTFPAVARRLRPSSERTPSSIRVSTAERLSGLSIFLYPNYCIERSSPCGVSGYHASLLAIIKSRPEKSLRQP